jgi:hypothetical protein
MRYSRFPPLGAAASRGQPSEQPRHPAELSRHGADAAEWSGREPEVSAVEMSPVNGELVSKLDSETAMTGLVSCC